MTYAETMRSLRRIAKAAVKSAETEDGAPAAALRDIAAEIDCLAEHNCTRRDLEAARKDGMI